MMFLSFWHISVLMFDMVDHILYIPYITALVTGNAGNIDLTAWSGDPHAMAGVGATNQVYNTIYFLVGFLPNLVTPSVAEARPRAKRAGTPTKRYM